MNNKNVTIEKWYVGKKVFYWIVDNKGNGIDGFTKKYQAINAIKKWKLNRVDKSIKERK